MSENIGEWLLLQRVLTQLWDKLPKRLSEKKTTAENESQFSDAFNRK